MSKREKLRLLKKEQQITKIEKKIYLISLILFFLTNIFNILTIINYPSLLNGIILEINIIITTALIYLISKKKKKITKIQNQKLNLKYN